MSISPARQAAYKILRRIDAGHDFAVDLLHSPQFSRLGEADHRLATEIVMGALRWQGELDFSIETLSGKKLKYFDPEILTILRLSVYQIQFLSRIPKPAVVNEAVELAKMSGRTSAGGLVNAVLRKCEASQPGPLPEGGEGASQPFESRQIAAAVRSLPAWLRERWIQHFGNEATSRLALASVTVPRTTLRVEGSPARREEIQRRLAEEGIGARPGRYASQALVIESGSFRSSTMVEAGEVVIQDEASQLVAALVSPRQGEHVLDLCAAPGIKTGQLAAAMGAGALVACDSSSRRLATMKKLLPGRFPEDLHLSLIRLDAAAELPFVITFDRVLVDAPCSGTGTLARNPEIKWRLRPDDLAGFAERQIRMLQNALRVLRPGGRLVYSTCSLEPEENEGVVEAVIGSRPGVRRLSADEISEACPELSPLLDSDGYFRTRPDLHRMDGFFAAVLEKDLSVWGKGGELEDSGFKNTISG